MSRSIRFFLPLTICATLFGQTPSATPTKTEAERFLVRCERAFAEADARWLSSQLFSDSLANRVLEGVGSNRTRPEVQGAVRGIIPALGPSISDSLQLQGMKPTAIRIMEGRKGCIGLMRLLSSDDAANFWELELEKVDGQVRCADLYVYMNGERLSKTVSRQLSIGLQQVEAGQSLSTALRFVELANTGNYPEALRAFAQMSPEMRQSKNMLMMRRTCAMHVSSSEFQAALHDLDQHLAPWDPARMVLLDIFLMKRDFERATAILDMLEDRTGGDSWIDGKRSAIRSMQASEGSANSAAWRR